MFLNLFNRSREPIAVPKDIKKDVEHFRGDIESTLKDFFRIEEKERKYLKHHSRKINHWIKVYGKTPEDIAKTDPANLSRTSESIMNYMKILTRFSIALVDKEFQIEKYLEGFIKTLERYNLDKIRDTQKLIKDLDKIRKELEENDTEMLGLIVSYYLYWYYVYKKNMLPKKGQSCEDGELHIIPNKLFDVVNRSKILYKGKKYYKYNAQSISSAITKFSKIHKKIESLAKNLAQDGELIFHFIERLPIRFDS